MIFKIKNLSNRRVFNTHLGSIAINMGYSVEISDEKMMREIAEVKGIGVEEIQEPEPVEIRIDSDFGRYKVKDLRIIAKKVGMKRLSKLNREQLIEKLEEVYQ